jgi:hypothetical protein
LFDSSQIEAVSFIEDTPIHVPPFDHGFLR